MTSNTSRFWSQSPITTNLTYSNNKKQGTGISYDLEGNLTQDTDLQYTYDAAGRSGSVFSAASNKTITPIYDGDGQVVHRTEVEGSTTIANLYQLRSTVMGGSVITELDSAGQKKKGFVYCNGKVIARQEPNVVVWEHENPFTGTRGISGRDGVGSAEVEPDALGVDMGLFDPFPVPEQWEPPADGLISLLPGSGSPSGRCTFDGMPILCVDALSLLRMGVDFEAPTVVWDGGWVFVSFNRKTEVYETQNTVIIPTVESDRVFESVTVTRRIEWDTEELFRIFAFQPGRRFRRNRKGEKATPPPPSQNESAADSTDPCEGKKGKLVYTTSVWQHIVDRHVRGDINVNASKYNRRAWTGSIVLRKIVAHNQLTFDSAKGFRSRGNFVYVYAYPIVEVPYLGPTSVDVGSDANHGGQSTNVNTVILRPDCKTVVTSHPGLPTGVFQGDPRITGTPMWAQNLGDQLGIPPWPISTWP